MRAYVGLGSNLDDPTAQVRRALVELLRLPASRLAGSSRLYRNLAMDLPGQPVQPDYVNAVAALDTRLPPQVLLRLLLKLELRHQRVRQRRWGPRTLDLDLLLYGNLRLRRYGLTLPHPGLHLRVFVLYPLAELAPHLVIPGRGRLSPLLTHRTRRGLHPLPLWQKRDSIPVHPLPLGGMNSDQPPIG
ncbi:2-amino-4-hydroxy-6-hydroxymethyldihydropteridinediphosphokinase [Gammaproteobacteria bacterium]